MSLKLKRVLAVLVLIALVFGWYVTLFGIGDKTKDDAITSVKSALKYGLDIDGGVYVVMEAKTDLTGDELKKLMEQTRAVLDNRVNQMGVAESSVTIEGNKRLRVEIPGMEDAEDAIKAIGKTAQLYFILADGSVVLDGSHVKDAQIATDGSYYKILLDFDSEGATLFEEGTRKAFNREVTSTIEGVESNQIAIVLDNEIVVHPNVNSVISGGSCEMTGNYTKEDASMTAALIRGGALPVELEEVQSSVQTATIGAHALDKSIVAGAIGLGIVFLLMLIFYGMLGLVADIALLLYVVMFLWSMVGLGVVMTLPGIAALILSIGMAVDANVIVFARIREELATGKTVKSAMQIGYDKALSAIIDGNVTTLIAAAVLWLLGPGTVKGFAQTLALGIVLSMFTALVVTKYIMKAFYALGLKDPKWYGVGKEHKTVNFLGKKGIFFGLSLAVIAVGFITMGVYKMNTGDALNYSLEFKGGTATTVTFDKSYTLEEINSEMVPLIESTTGSAVQIQTVQGSNEVIFKTGSLDVDQRQALNQVFVDNFGVDETLITSETISSTISNEMKSDTILAVAVAIICMLIYIRFRFSDIRFGVSSIACLLHDVLVVITFYALARVSVSNTFIACLLTIVGYSINATIVIFDRVRENMAVMTKKDDLQDVVNHSITQTLSRSLFTSLTTLVMVGALYIWGVTSIRDFALPLMVGIICGAYSSVCIAGALWYVLRKKFAPKAK